MDADLKKLKKIVKFMQKEGVLEYKTSDIALSLSPLALFKEEKSLDSHKEEAETLKPTHQYTDEEILMWSAQGFVPEEGAPSA